MIGPVSDWKYHYSKITEVNQYWTELSREILNLPRREGGIGLLNLRTQGIALQIKTMLQKCSIGLTYCTRTE